MNKSMQKIIDTIQAHMEEGALVWHNPCLIATQSNVASGNAYQGINQFITALVADAKAVAKEQTRERTMASDEHSPRLPANAKK